MTPHQSHATDAIEARDSGVVDLHALSHGAATPTAFPFAIAARPRFGRMGGAWAATAFAAAMLTASGVFAAVLAQRTGPAPAALVAQGTAPAASSTAVRGARGWTGLRVVMASADSAQAGAPSAPVGTPGVDATADATVVASATSPMVPRHVVPRASTRVKHAPAPEPAPAGPTAQGGGEPLPDDLASLIDRALAGDAAAAPDRPALPALPERRDVAAAMRAVAPQVSSCAPEASGVVQVHLKVDGPTGRIGGVSVAGDGLGDAARACIAGAVGAIELPRFERTGFAVTFPYVL